MGTMQLRGTVTLITGGSSGIGAATAEAVAAAGSRPLLVGRDRARLGGVAERSGGTPIVADLAAPGGPETAGLRALETAGRVDVLVNNAGVGWAGDLGGMSSEEVTRLVNVNLAAPIHLTRMLLPAMTEHGAGHVVHVSSIAGATGVGGEAVYSATKSGLNTFADATRAELAGTGVGVSVVVPGVVETAFFDARGTPYDRRWPRPVPAQRLARAIVDAVHHEHAEVFVPRWMRLPARLRGGFPAVYRLLATRFG